LKIYISERSVATRI